jgi:hypothetical protein
MKLQFNDLKNEIEHLRKSHQDLLDNPEDSQRTSDLELSEEILETEGPQIFRVFLLRLDGQNCSWQRTRVTVVTATVVTVVTV